MKNCIDCNKKLGDFYAKRCKGCSNKIKWSGKTGENSPFWKDDNATYKQKHSYINKNFGKATHCENPQCRKISNFFEWANISGTYKRDRSDWMMACHSCNQIMDYNRRNGNNCKNGHEYTEKNTYWTKTGNRTCRICKKLYAKEWRKNH